MPLNLKVLKTGTFSYCYFTKDTKIMFKEGLETIESKVFSSGGIDILTTLKLPHSVKNIVDGAFEKGMNIITDLPYNNRWFNEQIDKSINRI